MNSPFAAQVPQLYANVDRDKVLRQGVALGDVYQTLQTFLGGLYVNQFNRFGRQWRVFVQAEGEDRQVPEQMNEFYVRNSGGDMVPLSALQSVQQTCGPPVYQPLQRLSRCAGERLGRARVQLGAGDGGA